MTALLATKPHYRAAGGGLVPAVRAGSMFGDGSNVAHTAYKGAGNTRDIVAWQPRRGSADSDLLRELPLLTGRSRDIERNNGVASGVIRTLTDNVVGTGFRLVPRPNYLALGLDKAWADAWALQVSALWWQWAETTACHAGDTMIFDQLTTQVLRGQLLNGGALGLPLWIPDRGDGFATKLQTVEIDRLSNPQGAPDTQFRRGGIDFGSYGEPKVYNIRNAHPGDALLMGAATDAFTWTPVPRRTDFGRARVLHIFDPERPAQSRGRPLLAPVLSEFKNVDRYTMAELQAAVVNAMIALVVKTPMEMDAVGELFRTQENYLAAREEHGKSLRMESGGILPLFPGDEASSFLPQRPATGFGAFLEVMHRIIGLPAGLPYELVMKDFSKTNYSSARASMLEAWRSFLRMRDWLGTQWCDPVYDLWLEEMVNAGKIEAPSFYAMRACWTRCRWIGPGRGWVDPVKEAQAAQIRMASFITTLEDECAELTGGDWREKLDQAAVERAYKIEKGLPPDLVINAGVKAKENTTQDTSPNADNPDATPDGDASTQASIYRPGNIPLDTSGDEPLPMRDQA